MIERDSLKNSDLENPCDLFFLDVIPVLPPRTRPVQNLGNRIIDNIQTHNYKFISESAILTSNILKAVQDGVLHDKLHTSLLKLQSSKDCLLDENMIKQSSGNHSHGLKQIIEKKTGMH